MNNVRLIVLEALASVFSLMCRLVGTHKSVFVSTSYLTMKLTTVSASLLPSRIAVLVYEITYVSNGT